MFISNIFNNSILIIRSWISALWRGRTRSFSGELTSILIFQSAKLGDMVCTTPVFRAIKERYPNCKVTVVGDVTNQELLHDHPDVDDYLIWDKNIEHFRRQIVDKTFDAACMITPNFTALAVLLASNISVVVAPKVIGGWCPFQTISYRLLLPLTTVVYHRFNHYAPREYLKLLSPLGIDTKNTQKYLYHSQQATKTVDKFLDDQGVVQGKFFVAMSVSSGNKIKNWGGKKFAAVADHIYRVYGYPIVIIGGPNDIQEVDELIQHLHTETKIVIAAGLFTIDELKALIARAGLFVSVDTGPIYIAEAYSVPTVDIVGPMSAVEQPPVGSRHVVVCPPEPRVPQLHIMNARVYDVAEAIRQTESITVSMVTDALDDLIEKLSLESN